MGYRGKTAEQEQARALRAQSWTLNEIATHLGVSKSSVSLWVRDVAFTPRPGSNKRKGARNRPPNKLQRAKQEEIELMRVLGRERVGDLSNRDLMMAGLALYAGEGSKTDGSVRFANTNVAMMKLFCDWLRTLFTIDESRLRGSLYLHQGLDLAAATAHWSGVTNIPEEQFRKPYRALPDPTIRKAKHVYGCASVTYCCSRTHRAIMGMLEAMLEPFTA